MNTYNESGSFYTRDDFAVVGKISRGVIRVFVERSTRRKPAKAQVTSQRGATKATNNVQ